MDYLHLSLPPPLEKLLTPLTPLSGLVSLRTTIPTTHSVSISAPTPTSRSSYPFAFPHVLIGPVLVPVYSWFAFWFSQDTSELWSFDSLSFVSFGLLNLALLLCLSRFSHCSPGFGCSQ